MLSFLHSILVCLTGGSCSHAYDDYHPSSFHPDSYSSLPRGAYLTTTNEKLDLLTQQTAENIVQAMITASKPGPDLDLQVSSLVSAAGGWSEYLANAVLTQLSDTLKADPHNWGQALSEAVKKTTTAAWEFAKEHPVYTTLIALGVLVFLAPWVLEILGFGALGPEEGQLPFVYYNSRVVEIVDKILVMVIA